MVRCAPWPKSPQRCPAHRERLPRHPLSRARAGACRQGPVGPYPNDASGCSPLKLASHPSESTQFATQKKKEATEVEKAAFARPDHQRQSRRGENHLNCRLPSDFSNARWRPIVHFSLHRPRAPGRRLGRHRWTTTWRAEGCTRLPAAVRMTALQPSTTGLHGQPIPDRSSRLASF